MLLKKEKGKKKKPTEIKRKHIGQNAVNRYSIKVGEVKVLVIIIFQHFYMFQKFHIEYWEKRRWWSETWREWGLFPGRLHFSILGLYHFIWDLSNTGIWNTFFFFFSGVTTSILAPEQSPNICFDFFTLVFCLKHKCIWNHRGNELGDECCDNLLWVSVTPLCLIGYVKILRPCLLFTWVISQELCLQQAVLTYKVRSFPGTENRLA